MRCRMARATYPQTRWAPSSSAYLVLLRVEIGRFTPGGGSGIQPPPASRTRLCSSDPRLTADGGYPLRCPVESRLSSVRPEWHSDRLARFALRFYALGRCC